MFKRTLGLLILASALGACDYDPTGPELEAPPAPAFALSGGSEIKNKIVFVDRKPGPASEIWVMRPDGSNRQFLTRGAHPDVSPDGRRIAFTSYSWSLTDLEAPLTSAIHLINVDGTNEVVLTPDGLWDSEPKWSPDGRQILFRHNAERTNAITWAETTGNYYLMNANGTNRREIPVPLYRGFCLPCGPGAPAHHWGFSTWSIDGPLFWTASYSGFNPHVSLFRLPDEEHEDLYLEPAGRDDWDVSRWGRPVQVYEQGIWVNGGYLEGARRPRWSPDEGLILAEVELSEGVSELWTMAGNLCGDPTPVAHAVAGTARWSRTGNRILFESPGDGELYAVRADGSELWNLTPGSPDAPDFFTQRPSNLLPVTFPLCGGGEIGL